MSLDRPGNVGINEIISRLMIHAGYQVDPGGVCYGLTLMSIQAILAGEIERNRFFDRLRYIQEHESTLIQQLSDPDQSYKKNQKIVSDILPFFDGIALYQEPDLLPDYGKQHPTRTWDQLENVERVLPLSISSALEQQEALIRVKRKRFFFEDEKKMYHFAHQITRKIESIINHPQINKNNIPISMLITAAYHAMSLTYLPKQKHWLLFDANQAPYRIVDPQNLPQELMQAIAAGRDHLPEKFDSDLEIYTTGHFLKVHGNIFKSLYRTQYQYKRKSLLYQAIHQEDPQALKAFLLRHRDKLHRWIRQTKAGKTPIQTALGHGHIDHAIALLEALKDPEAKNITKETIHQATRGMLKTLALSHIPQNKIIQFICFLNQYDPDLWPQLLDQHPMQHYPVLQQAIAAMEKPKARPRAAAKQRIKKIFRTDQANQKLLPLSCNTPIFTSSIPTQSADHLFILENLDQSKNVFWTYLEKNQSLPLDFLKDHCQSEQREVIKKRLLKEKVEKEYTVVDKALESADAETMNILMAYGWDPLTYQSHNRQNILHALACQTDGERFYQLIQILKQKGLSEDMIKDFSSQKMLGGHTPLSYALASSPSISRFFLQYNHDWNQRNEQGKNLLHYMVYSEHIQTIYPILLKEQKKTQIDTTAWLRALAQETDTQGISPLFEAILARNINAISFFIQQQLPLTSQDHAGNNILHYALQWNDLNDFQDLITVLGESNASLCDQLLNQKNLAGKNLLHYMVYSEHIQTIYHLLLEEQQKTQVNTTVWLQTLAKQTDAQSISPLFEAILARNINAIFFFIQQQLPLTSRDYAGNNILHYALQWNDLNHFQDLVTVLWESNPSLCNQLLNQKNLAGQSPFDQLFSYVDNPLLQHINQHKALPIQFLKHFAREQSDLIKYLLQQPLDETNRRPIDIVMQHGNREQITTLMDYGFDFKDYHYFSDHRSNIFHALTYSFYEEDFHQAIELMQLDQLPQETIFKLLSQKTKQGQTPLAVAIKTQNQEALSYFMKHLNNQYDWYQQDGKGQTLLHLLASWQDPHLLYELFFQPLADIAHVDGETWLRQQLPVKDADGASALLEATAQHNIALIRSLLECEHALGLQKTLSPQYRYDHQGNNLFHYAVHWQDAEHFQALIDMVKQHDPDSLDSLLNAPNKLERTPLQCILHSSSQLPIISLLFQQRVSIQSLFHYAASWEEEPLKQLMQQVQRYYPGALPDCLSEKNENGQTPADIAKIHGKPDPLQYYHELAPLLKTPTRLAVTSQEKRTFFQQTNPSSHKHRTRLIRRIR